jgi:hypothetical protein
VQRTEQQLARQQQSAAKRKVCWGKEQAALLQQVEALTSKKQALQESRARFAAQASASAFMADRLAREQRSLQAQLAQQAAQHESTVAAITSSAVATAARLKQEVQAATNGHDAA